MKRRIFKATPRQRKKDAFWRVIRAYRMLPDHRPELDNEEALEAIYRDYMKGKVTLQEFSVQSIRIKK